MTPNLEGWASEKCSCCPCLENKNYCQYKINKSTVDILSEPLWMYFFLLNKAKESKSSGWVDSRNIVSTCANSLYSEHSPVLLPNNISSTWTKKPIWFRRKQLIRSASHFRMELWIVECLPNLCLRRCIFFLFEGAPQFGSTTKIYEYMPYNNDCFDCGWDSYCKVVVADAGDPYGISPHFSLISTDSLLLFFSRLKMHSTRGDLQQVHL